MSSVLPVVFSTISDWSGSQVVPIRSELHGVCSRSSSTHPENVSNGLAGSVLHQVACCDLSSWYTGFDSPGYSA